MERLLVTGIDGLVGMNLALKLAEHYETLGLYTRHVVDSPHMQCAWWHADAPAALHVLARDWRPQWIIHCGPLSASNWDPPPCDPLAVAEPHIVTELAALAARLTAQLTVISSDAVFTGPRMFHDETSPADDPTPRAAHVLAMERALADTQALVVRTHAYGWSPVETNAGFAQRAFEALGAGALAEADGLRHATPILATDLAELLARAYELRLHGLYHLAGAERASPFRFVSEMAGILGLHVPPGRAPQFPSTGGRRDETSLNSKRARRLLELATPLVREGLARFAEQNVQGWRDRMRAVGAAPYAHEVAA